MDMKYRVIRVLKDIVHTFGVELSRYESKSDLARKGDFDGWETLSEFLIIYFERLSNGQADDVENKFIQFVIENYRISKSQLFQDLLVLFLNDNKKHGYFVEFGATNGISFSNSYLLEKSFGWKGILAEPGITWQRDLKTNRDCLIDFRCVWGISGQDLIFNETECAELSTIDKLTEKDNLSQGRINRKRYSVKTVSLNDLLLEQQAPKEIDYLSVDTEGSELQILQNFDFSKYKINIISVEHNDCEPDRSEIFNLLDRNGFKRIFQAYSHCDDWYCRK